MYGHNFAYFDPNIWYNEEEMRKQVEQLNGCWILTGLGGGSGIQDATRAPKKCSL